MRVERRLDARWAAVPKPLSRCSQMCAPPQSCSRKTSCASHAQNSPAPERLDEELSSQQERPPENLPKVGWAKSRPDIVAFTLCKACAPKFHQNKAAVKSKTLGGYFHPEPRACCLLLRSPLPRISLVPSQRARLFKSCVLSMLPLLQAALNSAVRSEPLRRKDRIIAISPRDFSPNTTGFVPGD